MAYFSLLVGAGIVVAVLADSKTPYGEVTTSGKSTNVALHTGLSREEKWKTVGHKGITLWMTGLSGSGKSTVSVALEHALVKAQSKSYFVYRLDGDNLRFGLNSDLGFTPEDRKENVRRVAEVSKLFAEAGAIVIAGLISPYRADRQFAREVHENASLPFMEVFIDAPLNVVEDRDPKGLYKKARDGKIKGFTGIDAPYEKPENPEVHIRTDLLSIPESVNTILYMLDHGAGIHMHRKFRKLPSTSATTCAP
jgi:adenylylsulfate kinase